MAIKPLYLEPDEEITSVIDKISAVTDRQIAIVVPKNSALFQSLINLKLLAKEAKKQDKQISIISSNKVGQRLAEQVGLKTYSNLGAIQSVSHIRDEEPTLQAKEESEVVDGIRVNRYVPPAVTGQSVSTEESADMVEPSNTDAEQNADTPEPSEAIEAKEPEEKPELKGETESMPESNAPPEKINDSADKGLPAIVSRGFDREKKPFHIPWRSVIISAVIIIVLFVLVYMFIPRATVTATFPATSLNQTLSLDITSAGNNQGLTVTGTAISSDKTVTKTVTATGTKDIGTKATGTITITNEYKDSGGIGKDETLTAGTIVTDTKTKLTFTLDKTVSVGRLTYNSNNGQPIYQSQTADVTATTAGDSYNIGASTFTITGALANTVVTSSKAFSGGLSKKVTILSQDDIDTALADLKGQATSQTTEDLNTQANGKTILDGATWQVGQTQSVDHAAGDQVDSATATYELKVATIAFDKTATLNAIKGNLSSGLKDNQQLVIQNDSDVVYAFKSVNDAKTDMTVAAAIQAYVIANVDTTTLAKAVVNKSVGSAKTILTNNYGATDANVEISPSWWPGRLPLLAKEITVKFSFATSQ